MMMSPSPTGAAPDKKKLKDAIFMMKNDKRSGKWTSDPDNPSRGIFPAPADEQKEYRRNLKEKIKAARKQL